MVPCAGLGAVLLADLPVSFLETTFVVHLVALRTGWKKNIEIKLATYHSLFFFSSPLFLFYSKRPKKGRTSGAGHVTACPEFRR